MELIKRFFAFLGALGFGLTTFTFVILMFSEKSWSFFFVALFSLGATASCWNFAKNGSTSEVVKTKPVVVPKESVSVDEDLKKLGEYYLKDIHKEILKDVTASNLATSVNRLEKVRKNLEKCRISISSSDFDRLVNPIREKNEEELRKQELKAEQARIKEQIREEQKVEREMQAKIKKMEDEEKALERALQIALKSTNDQHSAEIEKLRAEIAELHAKTEREKSNAQLTKAGNVYVISNIGSFGESLFKVGMTRRSDPMDRVDELSDASVPFPFDVHMMIPCDDAPSLENKLHASLEKYRYNKVNLRKEFFKTDLNTITAMVRSHHGEPVVFEVPRAEEYRESMILSSETGYGQKVTRGSDEEVA